MFSNALDPVAGVVPGDVNGDGYADLVTWSPNTTPNAIVMSLLLGSASGLVLSPSSQVTQSVGAQSLASWALAGGDVNGDGYADVIGGDGASGHAYVYFGGPNGLPTAASQTIDPPLGAGLFGIRVTFVGDVNGDGYGDVVVNGGYFENGSGTGVPNTHYLYLGGPSGLSAAPAVVLAGCSCGTGCGDAGVAAGGDVNGDGYSDVLISCGDGLQVFLGGPTGPNANPNTTYSNTNNPTSLWYTGNNPYPGAMGIGDINGDGIGDFVGVQTGGNAGSLFVFQGAATLPMSPAQTLLPGGSVTDIF
jgi:hypothetical protein